MRNLPRCIAAVLASALRNLHCSQYQDFKSAFKCVSELVDFTLMAQYRSHTPDTLSYMESYLQTFNQTNVIFLEFHTSKATRAQANCQDRELRELMADQRAKEFHHRTVANRRRLVDQERVEGSDRRAYFIRRENHFNFIKIHYLTRLAPHRRHFGFISRYSTQFGELAHMDQIKDGYHRSNKNEPVRQILWHDRRHRALGIRFLTIETLSKVESGIVVEDSGREMPTVSSCSTPRRVLKHRMNNTTMLTELWTALDIYYSNMMEEILFFIRQTSADDQPLPNWGYFLWKGLLSLKSQCLTFRKLTGYRSTGPAALEQRHSATVALETIGCGSRLVGTGTMEIYKDAWWLSC